MQRDNDELRPETRSKLPIRDVIVDTDGSDDLQRGRGPQVKTKSAKSIIEEALVRVQAQFSSAPPDLFCRAWLHEIRTGELSVVYAIRCVSAIQARMTRCPPNMYTCCRCYPETQAPPNLWVCQKHIKGARRYMKLRAIAALLPRI